MTALFNVTAQPLPGRQANFAGHETFPFRYAWLKKGIDGLGKRSDIFTAEDAMVQLGVGKNMVRSIRHWCLATRVAEECEGTSNGRSHHIVPSAFGEALLNERGWDTYLQDDASLWLLHWNIATNPVRATTWWWAFNHFKEQEFTLDEFNQALRRWVDVSDRITVSNSSLSNDVSCFLRTYVPTRRGPTATTEDTLDCPLTSLGLFTELPTLADGKKRYRFNNGPKPGLPTAIFAYALLESWDRRHAGQMTLSLREITHDSGSPGRVFRLDEDAVLGYLDGLAKLSHGNLVFNDDAIVRHVVRSGEIQGRTILDAYYPR